MKLPVCALYIEPHHTKNK